MAVTVFTWDMFKFRPGDGIGVGHAALFIHGQQGNTYISFWPAQHTLKAGWSSSGVVHFINGDIKAEMGLPDWTSKPIEGLDEHAMIQWWSHVQHNPLIDYKHKTATQISGASSASAGNRYSIVLNQCAITVVYALWTGSNAYGRARIVAWLAVSGGRTPSPFEVKDSPLWLVPLLAIFSGSIPGSPRLPTVTPRDVRGLVEAAF